MEKTKKFYIIGSILCAGLFFAVSVFAQSSVTISTNIPGLPAQAAGSPNAVCGSIFNFYNYALAIAGILAFGAITYGGVLYTLAAGNPSGQSTGKEWVLGAIYGLLLLVGAYFILHFINPDITSCGLKPLPAITTAVTPSTPQGTSQVYCTSHCALPMTCVEGPPNYYNCVAPTTPVDTSKGVPCPPPNGALCVSPNICTQNVALQIYSCNLPPLVPTPTPSGQSVVCKVSNVTCPSPKVCKPQNLSGVFPPGWETCEDP